MATSVAANRLELLQIADAVARDKSIDKTVVLGAMEEAMQRAAKARYGSENEIRVEIDPRTGETNVSRYLHVVELVDNDKTEISLEDARARINVLSEIFDEWTSKVRHWSRLNEPHRATVDELCVPDRNEEYFIYQTLVGTWPDSATEREAFAGRLHAYVAKASRSAVSMPLPAPWLSNRVATGRGARSVTSRPSPWGVRIMRSLLIAVRASCRHHAVVRTAHPRAAAARAAPARCCARC